MATWCVRLEKDPPVLMDQTEVRFTRIYHFQHLDEYLCAVSLLALSTHSMLLMAHSILHHMSHNQGSVWGISCALSVFFFLFFFFSAFPFQLQGLKEPFESNPKGMKLPVDSRPRALGCL